MHANTVNSILGFLHQSATAARPWKICPETFRVRICQAVFRVRIRRQVFRVRIRRQISRVRIRREVSRVRIRREAPRVRIRREVFRVRIRREVSRVRIRREVFRGRFRLGFSESECGLRGSAQNPHCNFPRAKLSVCKLDVLLTVLMHANSSTLYAKSS